MKKFILAFTFVYFALAMSACVKSVHGPSDNMSDAMYAQSVKAAVDSKETIKFMDKGYWLANAAEPGYGQTWGAFGTIVVTDKNLYFLFWNRDDNVFDVLRKLPVADIVSINHISSLWSPGDCLSIKDKDGRSDLFSCLEMYSEADLAEKNRVFLDCLNAARNSQ